MERVSAVAFLPLSRRPLSSSEGHTEATYMRLVTTLLTDGTFYFSPQEDLSLSRQARSKGESEREAWSWSLGMRRRLLALTRADSVAEGKRVMAWAYPVIRGFLEVVTVQEGLHLALISRLYPPRPHPPHGLRSHKRVGRRYTKRGADKAGQVANHVETEQRLWTPSASSSFVQVRGSIPLLWHQVPPLRPPLVPLTPP